MFVILKVQIKSRLSEPFIMFMMKRLTTIYEG